MKAKNVKRKIQNLSVKSKSKFLVRCCNDGEIELRIKKFKFKIEVKEDHVPDRVGMTGGNIEFATSEPSL